jgi:hypothetical protein
MAQKLYDFKVLDADFGLQNGRTIVLVSVSTKIDGVLITDELALSIIKGAELLRNQGVKWLDQLKGRVLKGTYSERYGVKLSLFQKKKK